MFVLHSSNKTENLAAHLATLLHSAPLTLPLTKEVCLIQGQGMERWLPQYLASQMGVFGNYAFFFPHKFFSALAQRIGLSLDNAAFDRDRLVWLLEAVLRDLDELRELERVAGYLQGHGSVLKRYQLALQLAQLFDQYQIMRPDMLAVWERGGLVYGTDNEAWQKILWLCVSKMAGQTHRGRLWEMLADRLNAANPGAFKGLLPERVCVFGINTLPPLFLTCLHSVSRHCQVHFFLLNPAQVFWIGSGFDFADKRGLCDQEAAPEGHPLLAALGQQGREFQTLLLERVPCTQELDSFELNEGDSTLQALQNDLLNDRLTAGPLPNDGSISLHACHSKLREVEVLKDLLLQAWEEDSDLALRDTVVMAPDIQDYEPFISAVFVDIPHAIADRSLRLDNALLGIFVQFLNLSQSRFGWREVCAVLEQPVVHASFGLSEADLALVNYWLQETQVRWGKSAAHKSELGLPESSENTWQAALDRLLMGYVVGSDEEFVDGVLPYKNIEGLSASALGGLDSFMRLLFEASDDLKQPRPRVRWTEDLLSYAEKLLSSAAPDTRWELDQLLMVLSEDAMDAANSATEYLNRIDIEFSVIVYWLNNRLDERQSNHGFLRGCVTFCSILPMRSIPFKVGALLGMDEGQFPKIDQTPAFDLLAANYRLGDRSSRVDNRYQFLEILLSTRQKLIITYVGQSMVSNEPLPPSVVVSELLDVLKNHYQLNDLITRHRLHAFSPQYFLSDSQLFSYSTANWAIAQCLTQKPPKPSNLAPWWQGHTPQKPSLIIELSDLLAFFRNPQKHFFAKQLGLRFQGIETIDAEREPFQLGFLDTYEIQHEWLGRQLAGKTFPLAKLQAQGRWPQGPVGELEFARQQPLIGQFIDKIKALDLGPALPDLLIDLQLGRFRIVGKLSHRHARGTLCYRFSTLKGKDFISAGLQHLIGNQIQAQVTWLLASDEAIEFKPEHCSLSNLVSWLDIYSVGQTRPDAFFVEAALAYVKAKADHKPPLLKANHVLAAALEKSYEPTLRQLYGQASGPLSVLGKDFASQCDTLLHPLWQATH